MKILYIDHDSINTGSTVSMNYIIRKFIEKGFEVTVYTPKQGEYLENLKSLGVNVLVSKWKNMNDMTLDLYFTMDYSVFSQKGFILLLKNLGKILWGIHGTISAINQVKPDIVYINEYAVIQAAIAARWKKVKSIIHIRSPFFKGHFGIRGYLLAACIQRYSDKIIAITRQEAQQIINYRPKAVSKITVIGEFLDEKNYNREYNATQWKASHNIPLESKIVFTLVGLLPHKGGLFFLKAAELVAKIKKNVVFVLGGKIYMTGSLKIENEYHEAETILQNPNLNERIICLGSMIDPIPAMAACDIYVSPFTATHFSRPLIEAWAQQKPVISTDIEHSRDIVENMKNGILVKCSDSQQLADAIMQLLDDEFLCRKIGMAGYTKARKEFDSERNTELIVSEVIGLLNH
jgi:glycosyltransferase involved in cell wall biosynthesis